MHELPGDILPLREERAVSRRIPWPLFAAGGVAILMLALFLFGREIMAGHGASLDREIMLAMREPGNPAAMRGPHWLPSVVRDVTALGSWVVLTMVVTASVCFLALRGRWRTAALVVAATVSGAVAVTFVKALIARSRPDLIGRLMEETSHSFPSGHAANSAIVYLTLASLLFPVVEDRRSRLFLIALALVLVAAIGVSRVYLGVHWPSDVLAGWTFGSLWALLWWRIETAKYGEARPGEGQ